MISFRYKNTVKRLKMSGKVTEDRISKALTDLFGLKGHVLGFKTDAGLI